MNAARQSRMELHVTVLRLWASLCGIVGGDFSLDEVGPLDLASLMRQAPARIARVRQKDMFLVCRMSIISQCVLLLPAMP